MCGRPGEREDVLAGDGRDSPAVDAVGHDEVGVVEAGVVPGRLRFVGAGDGPGGTPRYRPDRDTASAVERDEVRLDVGAKPGAQVVGLEPADDRILAVGLRGLRGPVPEGDTAAGKPARTYTLPPHPAHRPAHQP